MESPGGRTYASQEAEIAAMAATPRWKGKSRTMMYSRKLEVFLESLATFYLVIRVVIHFSALAAIAYCILSDRWLPAVFILLARKEFTHWLDREAERTAPSADAGSHLTSI